MASKKIKYAPAIVRDLSAIFAQKDSNAPGYLSGPKLISLFNSLGFADVYKFPGVGIKTPDEEGLSRTAYACKRLEELNEAYRIPEALTKFLKATEAVEKTANEINAVFSQYNVKNPLFDINAKLGSEQVVVDNPVEKPNVAIEVIKSDELSTHENKKIIDEEFDSIPTGVPVIFFSYSWDNEEHKEWVLNLSRALAKRGIYPLLDRYVKKGYSLTRFMDRGIDRADRVIVVGSSGYLEKSRKADNGGVQYEDMIISSEMMTNIASTKFIPVVRNGTFEECLPAKLSKRSGFDFSDESKYEDTVDELARAIYDIAECPRPTLGPIPNYTYENLTDREKENLKSPQSDFRKAQDRKWLCRLLGNFSFELMHTYLTDYPTMVDGRIFISLDIWNGIIGGPTFRIYDPELSRLISEFHAMWKRAENIGSIYYAVMPSSQMVKFYGLEHDTFKSREAEKAFGEIIHLQMKMQPVLKEMAIYIQDNFDIDVEETSRRFIESLA